MARFHLALTVADLTKSVTFYSRLFGAEPTVLKDDYAKWMLDDPKINLSLSTHGDIKGVDHVGLQADSQDEFDAMKAALIKAEGPLLEQPDTTCCYARSTKTWTHDPDNVAWETFLTHGESVIYGDGDEERARRNASEQAQACC
jgi:catechol 2,3-dioxygenase-like lactoylglutathione lyase family enzyme